MSIHAPRCVNWLLLVEAAQRMGTGAAPCLSFSAPASQQRWMRMSVASGLHTTGIRRGLSPVNVQVWSAADGARERDREAARRAAAAAAAEAAEQKMAAEAAAAAAEQQALAEAALAQAAAAGAFDA